MCPWPPHRCWVVEVGPEAGKVAATFGRCAGRERTCLGATWVFTCVCNWIGVCVCVCVDVSVVSLPPRRCWVEAGPEAGSFRDRWSVPCGKGPASGPLGVCNWIGCCVCVSVFASVW